MNLAPPHRTASPRSLGTSLGGLASPVRWSRAIVVAILLLSVSAAAARNRGPKEVDPFVRLAGAWAGTGTGSANLAAGPFERVACTVAYVPAGTLRLHIAMGCTSGNERVQIEADLSREGRHVEGTLVERSSGVPGTLSGTVDPDRIEAVVSGMGVSASLSLTMRGDVQTVTLRGLGSMSSAGASVLLRKL
jgi:hypothetical protein